MNYQECLELIEERNSFINGIDIDGITYIVKEYFPSPVEKGQLDVMKARMKDGMTYDMAIQPHILQTDLQIYLLLECHETGEISETFFQNGR